MIRAASLLALLVSLLLPMAVVAETRIVLIQLKREKDQTIVSIYSDEKKEQKRDISIAEAAPILEKMQGWGSSVEVYLLSDRGIPGGDLKKILVPICDNPWLDLLSYAPDAPPNVKEYFLGKKP